MNLFNNKIVKNASWIIAGKIAQMALSLVISLLTARFLGPANYGIINYAGAYIAFFIAFCNLGINSIIVKEFVDHPEQEGQILGTSLVLKIISSILSSIIIVLIVCTIDHGEKEIILVTALSSIGLIFQMFETFNYWFQAKMQSKVSALAMLTAYIVTSVYRVILIMTGKSVVWFALATSVDYLCVALILFYHYKKYGGTRLSFSWKYGKDMISRSYHFILSSVMVAIYGHTDKIMLKHMMDEIELGYYSTALAVCNMWCFVLQAIITSMQPSILEAFNKNDKTIFEQRNKQLYAIVFYLSVVVSTGITLLAPLIIRILYGDTFMGAVSPLRIITWYTAFSYLGVARNSWIVCNNTQKYLKYMYLVSAVGNVLMNLLLIPVMGTTGAALASLITQVFTIIIPLFVKDMRENTIWILESVILKGVFPEKIKYKVK